MSSRLNRLIAGTRRGARSGPSADSVQPPDLSEFDERDRPIIERAYPYTMTGVLRLDATVQSVRHCVRRGIPGAFCECGVWRGGSVLAMILTLQDMGVNDRDIHLFDTFEGMTEPTEHDRHPGEPPALETWTEAKARDERPWAGMFGEHVFDEHSVRETVLSSGYPEERIHLVKGPVEETIPDHAPDALALLRLDTDWYESTRHELEHLYPRLADGGVLLIDDYGHWEGARRAVDEYFSQQAEPLLLNRVDYTGRVAVKH
jgi:O-methyltransferase